MFAGHIGASLAIARNERTVNAGVFIFAGMLLDAVLWLFVLLGWESVIIPADFGRTHQAQFSFPFSHSLAGSIGWSALAGLAAYALFPRRVTHRPRAALLVGAAVFAHWVLDWLVHEPEMPLAGAGSHLFGLGLWRSMPLALAVEAGIVVLGLVLYLPGSATTRGKKTGLAVLCALIMGSTIFGMTAAPAPPSIAAMAISSLIMILVVTCLAWWLCRPFRGQRAG